MQQSREAEIEALKESVSRLALAIRDAKPDGRDALKSSWASASGRLQTLGWSIVGPDPFDASVRRRAAGAQATVHFIRIRSAVAVAVIEGGEQREQGQK